MDQQTNNTATGSLVVRVTTARGAIPLEGATVSIYNYLPNLTEGRGDIISVHKTDRSGLTEKIELPAPPRSQSQAPNSTTRPYSTYTIGVFYDGYYDQLYVNVPVFDGVTAVQSADLIPLPENGRNDGIAAPDTRFYESENSMLYNGGGQMT